MGLLLLHYLKLLLNSWIKNGNREKIQKVYDFTKQKLD